jgi:hypothetical protein
MFPVGVLQYHPITIIKTSQDQFIIQLLVFSMLPEYNKPYYLYAAHGQKG